MRKTADSVIAVDPGRSKCGVAVVRRATGPNRTARSDSGSTLEILHQSVVATGDLETTLADLAARFAPDVILVGSGTTSAQAAQIAEHLQAASVELVDEKFSSLLARKMYFRKNPPSGIRRLIPTSLQTPSRPYDDYVAVILAERYFSV